MDKAIKKMITSKSLQQTDVTPKLTLKQVAIISLIEQGLRDIDIVEQYNVSRSYIQK